MSIGVDAMSVNLSLKKSTLMELKTILNDKLEEIDPFTRLLNIMQMDVPNDEIYDHKDDDDQYFLAKSIFHIEQS